MYRFHSITLKMGSLAVFSSYSIYHVNNNLNNLVGPMYLKNTCFCSHCRGIRSIKFDWNKSYAWNMVYELVKSVCERVRYTQWKIYSFFILMMIYNGMVKKQLIHVRAIWRTNQIRLRGGPHACVRNKTQSKKEKKKKVEESNAFSQK